VLRAHALLAAALGLTACLDFAAAHDNCVRTGRCGQAAGGAAAGGSSGGTSGGDAGGMTAGGSTAGGLTAGGSGGAGGDAGGMAGGMAGGATAGGATAGGAPYDGGLSCPGSLRPRLQCDPPVVLSDGGLYSQPVLGFFDGGMVYGWANGLRFQVFTKTASGTTTVVDEVAATGISRAELDAKGDYWAAIYHSGEGQPIRCFASHGPTATSAGVAGYRGGAGIAVSPSGEVAVVRGYAVGVINHMGWAVTDAGCPATMFALPVDLQSDYVAALYSPVYGFRFTSSGQQNFSNGDVGLTAPLPDGGVLSTSTQQTGEGPEDHSAILSSNGTHALLATSSVDTRYVLRAMSLPISLATPLGQGSNYPITHRYLSWYSSGCGPGCMAVVYSADQAPDHVTAMFLRDAPTFGSLTSTDAGWDVACNTTNGDTQVKVAYAGGRLHVILGEPGVARLFSCDVPPL